MPNDLWSGNVGEWGEVFVLLHLLAYTKLHNADVHGQKIENEYGRIQALFRTETSGLIIEFEVQDNVVIVKHNDVVVNTIPQCEFKLYAHCLFEGMKIQGTTAKHSEQVFLQNLGCEGLKASSTKKADLRARLYDGFISTQIMRDYSVKTIVGGDPSLANASEQSYIDYELPGFDASKALEVNGIKGRSWVVLRTKKILELCQNPIPVIRSTVFKRNLLKCHWKAPEVIGLALLFG